MHRYPNTARDYILFTSIAALIVLADQITKWWIRSNLAIGQSIPETGFFRITHVYNTGAAFSIFWDNNRALIIVASIELVLVLVYFLFIRQRYGFLTGVWNTVASALILGGIIGNLIDRIHQGHVTDFIDVGPWPVFNVADSCGVVGVILFAVTILFFSHTKKQGS